jgi:hypothetical protein
MYFIQHKHYSWISWKRWGKFSSKKEAQKSLDHIEILRKIKPASIDGINFYYSFKGYNYRLSSK